MTLYICVKSANSIEAGGEEAEEEEEGAKEESEGCVFESRRGHHLKAL